MTSGNRPLSPHLQVYRPQITSILSITHRFTGVVLALGTVFLAYWLGAAAYGPDAFATAQSLFGSWFGQLLMLGWSFALFYHMCNGIRHLFWDAGYGFDLAVLRKSGLAVVAVSVALTAVTWILALFVA